MEQLLAFLKKEQLPCVEHLSLSAHSSFRIGGKARLAVYPQSTIQLVEVLRFLNQCSTPFAVIGMASNVLFSDSGYDGVLVFTTGCQQVTVKGSSVLCECGALLRSVASTAQAHGLTGLEFAHGIPGTVGGAVFMNAGAYGGCMQDVCMRSYAYDRTRDEIVTMEGDAQAFDIRKSIYTVRPEYTVLGAELSLKKGNSQDISALMAELQSRRRASQPLEYPSAGSVFKRPVGHFAGKLVEDCGWKGRKVGGAQVSEKHAGFVINAGGATCHDILTLMDEIRNRVFREFGVELEPEVKYLR